MSIFDIHPGAFIVALSANLLLGYYWYSPRIFGNAWLLEHELSANGSESTRESPLPQLIPACVFISWLTGVQVMLLHKGLQPAGGMMLMLACYVSISWSSQRILGKNTKGALIDSSYIAAATVLSYLLHSVIY